MSFTHSLPSQPFHGHLLGPRGSLGPLGRTTARLRSRRLDRAIADGARSEATPAVAFRTRRLIALSCRRSIAETYRRLVREARDGARQSRLRAIPPRTRVTAADDELIQLADALSQPGPVAARGVAQALLLLTDGTGPLYNDKSDASLRESAVRATDSLQLT